MRRVCRRSVRCNPASGGRLCVSTAFVRRAACFPRHDIHPPRNREPSSSPLPPRRSRRHASPSVPGQIPCPGQHTDRWDDGTVVQQQEKRVRAGPKKDGFHTAKKLGQKITLKNNLLAQYHNVGTLRVRTGLRPVRSPINPMIIGLFSVQI